MNIIKWIDKDNQKIINKIYEINNIRINETYGGISLKCNKKEYNDVLNILKGKYNIIKVNSFLFETYHNYRQIKNKYNIFINEYNKVNYVIFIYSINIDDNFKIVYNKNHEIDLVLIDKDNNINIINKLILRDYYNQIETIRKFYDFFNDDNNLICIYLKELFKRLIKENLIQSDINEETERIFKELENLFVEEEKT